MEMKEVGMLIASIMAAMFIIILAITVPGVYTVPWHWYGLNTRLLVISAIVFLGLIKFLYDYRKLTKTVAIAIIFNIIPYLILFLRYFTKNPKFMLFY
jgi:hypothetical protein